MQKKQVFKIIGISTIALIIPLLGNQFVDGWNWTWNDFVFAWVFFNILGFTFTFVTQKISNRILRIIAGIVVVGIFASVWVMLATG